MEIRLVSCVGREWDLRLGYLRQLPLVQQSSVRQMVCLYQFSLSFHFQNKTLYIFCISQIPINPTIMIKSRFQYSLIYNPGSQYLFKIFLVSGDFKPQRGQHMTWCGLFLPLPLPHSYASFNHRSKTIQDPFRDSTESIYIHVFNSFQMPLASFVVKAGGLRAFVLLSLEPLPSRALRRVSLSTNQSAIQAHKAETKRSSLIDLRSGSASCKLPKSPVLGTGQDILVAKAKRDREQFLYRGRTKCPRWCFWMYGDCGAGFQSRGVVNRGVG